MKRLLSLFAVVLILGGSSSALAAQDALSGLAVRAEATARAGRFDEAAGIYRRMVEAQPRSGELWSNLGAMQAMGGHCEEARAALDRARALNAGLFAPWYFGAYCELQLHRDTPALADLNHALKINPRDTNAWYLKAQAAANLGRLPEAFAAVVRALTENPDEPEGYYRAGKVALDLASRQYSRVMSFPAGSAYPQLLEGERDAGQGLWDLAIVSYRKAAAAAAQDPAVHFALATAEFEAGKLSEAESELRKCLSLIPAGRRQGVDTAWIRVRLALVLAKQGKANGAQHLLDSFEFELFRTPEEFADFIAAASQLGRSGIAADALRAGLARFPEDSYLMPWKAHLENGSANAAGSPASRHDPGGVGLVARFVALSNPQSLDRLADLLAHGSHSGDLAGALVGGDVLAVAGLLARGAEHLPAGAAQAFLTGELLQWVSYRLFERLATRFPQSDAAQRQAAENLTAEGHPEKALEIYGALLARRGRSPDLLRAVAQIRWIRREWDESLDVLKSVNQMDPYDATTLVNMGRIYSYRQELENAERCFARAAQIDPGMFEAHLGWAETLRRRGEEPRALREFKTAVALEPDNPRPHYSLAQLYRKSDNKELATREMQAFQRLQARAATEKAKPQLVPLE